MNATATLTVTIVTWCSHCGDETTHDLREVPVGLN